MPKTDKDGVVIPEAKFVNNPGSHVIFETEYYVDKEGNQQSRPGRKLDWFAYIQASKEQCDLSQIVARYLSGDTAVINVNSPIYGDVASMPRNINELHDLGDRIQKGYNNLSDEIKGIFGNSFDEFYKSVMEHTVDQKIQAYATAKAEAAAKAVKQVTPSEEGKEKGKEKGKENE